MTTALIHCLVAFFVNLLLLTLVTALQTSEFSSSYNTWCFEKADIVQDQQVESFEPPASRAVETCNYIKYKACWRTKLQKDSCLSNSRPMKSDKSLSLKGVAEDNNHLIFIFTDVMAFRNATGNVLLRYAEEIFL